MCNVRACMCNVEECQSWCADQLPPAEHNNGNYVPLLNVVNQLTPRFTKDQNNDNTPTNHCPSLIDAVHVHNNGNSCSFTAVGVHLTFAPHFLETQLQQPQQPSVLEHQRLLWTPFTGFRVSEKFITVLVYRYMYLFIC